MRRLPFNKRLKLLKDCKYLKGKVAFNVPMKRYTTMRVGGPAFALYQPDSLSSLTDFVKFCKDTNISYFVIGNGSNIIVGDKGTQEVIIKLSSPYFKKIEVCGSNIVCGGGLLLSVLCHVAEEHSLGGAEFLIGIPGTIGGALIQNAGAQKKTISGILHDVKVVAKDGNIKMLMRDELNFGYRSSHLKDLIVVGATFSLKVTNRKSIQALMFSYIEKRLSTQDYSAPSAGCIFKNPISSRLTAGQLLDRCGLKGKSHGGAYISKKHANFIINKKNARANDILELISIMKDNIRRRFGIELEEEVEIIS